MLGLSYIRCNRFQLIEEHRSFNVISAFFLGLIVVHCKPQKISSLILSMLTWKPERILQTQNISEQDKLLILLRLLADQARNNFRLFVVVWQWQFYLVHLIIIVSVTESTHICDIYVYDCSNYIRIQSIFSIVFRIR